MIKFENLYAMRKRYKNRYDWPNHDYWTVARKLGAMAERLENYAQKEKIYDPYMNEWIIACLDAFCAGAYDFIMHIDPDNSRNIAHWRADHKITLPTKQSVPLHFPYIPFNVRNALRFGDENYKTQVVPGMYQRLKWRKLTKYNINRDIEYRDVGQWEYIAKFWKKEFERTGRQKRWYGIWKPPFHEEMRDRDNLHKPIASYIVCLIMCAKELKERFMAGEFLNTDWKPKLNKAEG